MVMPRSCSSGSKSVSVVPSSTPPSLCLAPAVIEHVLRGGGLAGIDVGDDADITDFGEVEGWHCE